MVLPGVLPCLRSYDPWFKMEASFIRTRSDICTESAELWQMKPLSYGRGHMYARNQPSCDKWSLFRTDEVTCMHGISRVVTNEASFVRTRSHVCTESAELWHMKPLSYGRGHMYVRNQPSCNKRTNPHYLTRGSLTHSRIHRFETIPNSRKLQTTTEMWLWNDSKLQIA